MDDFQKGDRFEIFDFLVSLGTTSLVAVDAAALEVGSVAAFLDPTYSSGVFQVGPGAHSITIGILAGSFGAGRGYIKAETVPEPGTVLLLGAGLGPSALRTAAAPRRPEQVGEGKSAYLGRAGAVTAVALRREDSRNETLRLFFCATPKVVAVSQLRADRPVRSLRLSRIHSVHVSAFGGGILGR